MGVPIEFYKNLLMESMYGWLFYKVKFTEKENNIQTKMPNMLARDGVYHLFFMVMPSAKDVEFLQPKNYK